MNKELIKKYKPEFDHWLNGGNLLYCSNSSDIWYTVIGADIWGINSDLKIIINDEYVELRKALAEGKTIQCNRSYGEYYGNPPVWEDIPIQVLNNFSPEFLRIKPEEPQFKECDWVIDLRDNNLKQVVNPNSPAALSDYIKWKPQQGEWCWFWNNDKQPFLAQLACLDDEEYITVQVLHGSLADLSDACFSFEYCEPFIGTLPTHLKDK